MKLLHKTHLPLRLLPMRRANERFLAGVEPLVRLELPGLGERPRAAGVVALVWLLASVGPHVCL